MKKEYLRCPNCRDGQIYLMEVAGVKRGFYICSNCDLVWKRYWELNVPLASEWRWHDYLKKMGISPSNMKVTKRKPLVIVEEENLKDRSPEKEYLLCPHCAGNGIIERISIKGLKDEIDACDECDLTWEKGTALQSYSIGLFDDYIEKEGIPFSKLEIKKSNRLVLIEEDQV